MSPLGPSPPPSPHHDKSSALLQLLRDATGLYPLLFLHTHTQCIDKMNSRYTRVLPLAAAVYAILSLLHGAFESENFIFYIIVNFVWSLYLIYIHIKRMYFVFNSFLFLMCKNELRPITGK